MSYLISNLRFCFAFDGVSPHALCSKPYPELEPTRIALYRPFGDLATFIIYTLYHRTKIMYSRLLTEAEALIA